MTLAEQKITYERYLTERLDSGQSQNIVIPATVELILQKATQTESVRVLDIGCFSGAMLNRIRNEVSPEIQRVTEFVGADIDEGILEIGRRKYQGLDLRHLDLKGSVNHLGTFDIVILANIIHETLSENPNPDAKDVETEVKQILDKVSDLLSDQGNLVILDGLKPPNEESWLTINFQSPDIERWFKEFAQKYGAFPVQVKIDNGKFRTRMKDLAAFLTKARYLHEDYWPIESTQNYQYFTAEQFADTLMACGMIVKKIEPQRFTVEHLNRLFGSIDPIVDFPAKNVLIVAGKISQPSNGGSQILF